MEDLDMATRMTGERPARGRQNVGDEKMETIDVKHLVPANAQYAYDEATNTARIHIETRDPSTGRTGTATVVARLSVYQTPDDTFLDASYVSHEGYATEQDIAYACGAIETNDLGS